MINKYKKRIEEKLSIIFTDNTEYSVLFDSMNYSLLAGGKRIRPCLMLEFYSILNGKSDILDFAAAIEMIHTYSLIHDDLPCMDDDDYRRGRPSNHKQYSEAVALLAGDALLTEAFKIASNCPEKPERVVSAINVLASCSGACGMIGGQVLDLYGNSSDKDLILKMYSLKTAKLLIAASEIGCILAGADSRFIEASKEFALNLGIAFQIQDDILDVTGSYEKLGKPVLSDEKNDKNTFLSIVGLDNAKSAVKQRTDDAVKALKIFGDSANELKEFAVSLINRDK